MLLADLVAAFEEKKLPKEEWTHEAHLGVGLFYVWKYGKEKALEKIRTNIQAYNVATGGENTSTNGYHETITVFWIWAMEQFLKTMPAKQAIDKSYTTLLNSPFSKKDFPLNYYTKEKLLSIEARADFVAPDIKEMREITL